MPIQKGVVNHYSYVSGRYMARIKVSEIKSAGMTGNNQDPKKSARHMNSVFHHYYTTYNAVKDATASEKNPKSKQIGKAILADMEAAAFEGNASNGGDLVSVWKYLISNNGVWDRTSWFENFVSGPSGPMGGGGYVVPQGILAYEAAMQKRAQIVGKGLKSVFGGQGIHQYHRNLTAYKTDKSWNDIQANLELTNKFIDNTPQAWSIIVVAGKGMDTKYLDVAKRWINLGGYVHKFLTKYMEWEKSKFSTRIGEKEVAAIAAYLVDKAVPHFGSAYAEVIRGIPNAMEFMRRHRKRMDDAIALGNAT